MNSLVGQQQQSEDFAFCLQVDNARPRNLLPPSPRSTPSSVFSGTDSLLSPSSSKNRKKASRWESTPISHGKSLKTVNSASRMRSRAMRPWRPSGGSSSSTTGGSSIQSNNSSRKADLPIPLPQRRDSNRSLLTTNAKHPQRKDSNRNLKLVEVSERSLSEKSLRPEDLAMQDDSSRTNDLDVSNETESSRTRGEYLVIKSNRSLWSSASTMTASFRTMQSTSCSLMSHYSKESNRSLMNSIAMLEESSRSLFWRAENKNSPVVPLRPPRRYKSKDDPFETNVSERLVRRPVRTESGYDTLGSAITNTLSNQCSSRPFYGRNMPTTTTNQAQAPDLPELPSRVPLIAASEPKKHSSNSLRRCVVSMPSICLTRSVSEQTLERVWREAKGAGLHNEAVRSLFKRSSSDTQFYSG